MATEIYKGRKIVTGTRRGSVGREAYATVNGVEVEKSYFRPGVQDELADSVRRYVDRIDQDKVDGDRWGIHWYDPSKVELCPEGFHPQEIGGQCQHRTCMVAV